MSSTGLIHVADVEHHLELLASARKWLAEAKVLADVLHFRDQLAAIEHYRKVSGEAVEACNEAAEMKLRAERKVGQLLENVIQQGGDRKSEKSKSCDTTLIRLPDIGLSRDQSANWQKVASMPEELFEDYLRETRAAGEQITTAGALRVAKVAKKNSRKGEVRERATGAEVFNDLAVLVAQGRKFGCIYADPPWVYDNQRTRGATSDHYAGMSIDEIAAMPIAQLAEDNAHLWLWTTNAFLFDCPRIIAAWDFSFRSSFIWCKPQMGMGNYLRCSHEFLLLAIRGSAPFKVRDQRSWGEFDRGAHSAKPEQVRLMVERCSEGDYLELFGRREVNGWTVFGNQVSGDMFTTNREGVRQ